MRRILVLAGVLGLAVWACVEEPTAPARCPDFCPSTKIVAVESLLPTAITGDSTFGGFVDPQHTPFLPATAEGGVDSRPLTQMTVFPPTTQLDSVDTTTGVKVMDSMKLIVRFLRPDTASHNLRLAFYQLPDSIDSTTTLAGLASSFAAAPLRVVNVDSLLSVPSRRDSVAGDTVLLNGLADTNSLITNNSQHVVALRLKFDSAHAPFNAADSGRLSLGVLVTADNRPSLTMGAQEIALGLSASWFYRVDSAGKLIRPDSIFYKDACSSGTCTHTHPPDSIVTNTNFDTFVYTAPAIPADSNLLVGGVPVRRSLLRINFPRQIRDSSQVLRAQLLLIPTATAPLPTGDSVVVMAQGVATDLGLKSPLSTDTVQGVSRPFTGTPSDTLRIEVTTLFRFWQFDTTQTTTVFLRLLALRRAEAIAGADTTGRFSSIEGGTFTTLRFFSSRTAAFRPMLRLTYVPRVKLGAP